MPEPNPYEPPRVNEPIRTMAKRASLATIVWFLTPLAVVIAGTASCGITNRSLPAILNFFESYFWLIVIGSTICFLPPLATLYAMVWLAQRITYAERMATFGEKLNQHIARIEHLDEQ